MSSNIAWLDTSAEEQRRIREIVELFSQRESRDELGIGQIRDVFSDLLFPGTSVIQTRARYFLLVPWVFRASARRGLSGAAQLAHANSAERRLVEMLRSAGVVDGLIGRRAGAALKILPSSIYWSGMRTYGILTHDVGADRLNMITSRLPDGADELATRIVGDWHPSLPSPPDGFPKSLTGGLNLELNEARWLMERMLSAASGTLLAHLLVASNAPDRDSAAPWSDSVAATAPTEIRNLVRHAEFFSLAMNGAALLYNVLVGERYEAAGLTRVKDPVEWFRGAYDEWVSMLHDRDADLRDWNRSEFAELILARNQRTSRAHEFVMAWTEAVLDRSSKNDPDNTRLRALVAGRERGIKKAQSRLTNDKLLGAWSGDSGSGRLTYRWSQVRRIVTDVHEGLDSNAGA